MPIVVVDWNRCSGAGTCIDACPVSVFELQELTEHPETLKAVPTRMDKCSSCMKCVLVCVEHAITVEEDPETC